MKLVVAGASGFVGTEIVKQCLANPAITSVVALSRKAISPPSNLSPKANASKLTNAVVEDYGNYGDAAVQKEIAGADACIWTVAITPSKQKDMPFSAVKKVCQTDAIAGLDALFAASKSRPEARKAGRPFKFTYMSGVAAERDQTKKPWYKPEYCLMRGETENMVLKKAKDSDGQLQCSVAKPGVICGPGEWLKRAGSYVLWWYASLPKVEVSECAAALVGEMVREGGFSVETATNADLVRIGQESLAQADRT